MGEADEMGQSVSLAPVSIAALNINVRELTDLSYEKSLGSARFMKSIRARHKDGLVVVRVVMRPNPEYSFSRHIRDIKRE